VFVILFRKMLFVNFKTYKEATGKKALELAKICQLVAEKTTLKIIPVAQAADIFRLSQAGIEVWSQHVDDIEYGPNTGQLLPEAMITAGAKGTLLNHSENKLPTEVIRTTLVRCRQLGLKVMVITASVEEAQRLAADQPDFLAFEPPEFIGSRTESVASARPESISEFVKKFNKLPVLVGAGIQSGEDVTTALKLGAKGVLVASGVVLAKDPKKKLLDLAAGFSKAEK
jgi:triosephosphate isomerase